MLGHNRSLNKFKEIEIVSCIFSDHNAMELEMNHKKETKYTKTWKLNILLNNECINNEIKKEIKYPGVHFPLHTGGTPS